VHVILVKRKGIRKRTHSTTNQNNAKGGVGFGLEGSRLRNKEGKKRAPTLKGNDKAVKNPMKIARN